MTDRDARDSMRETAREILRELMGNGNGHTRGDPDVVAQVPAPPVAAVLRPSTWAGPEVPGEVIGDGDPAPVAEPEPNPDPDARVEHVVIDTDADLERFVHALAIRLENPRERRAISSGRLTFALRHSARVTNTRSAIHIKKGAVTERVVREAAASGARMVLAPGAVLTPLARDQARALRVEIERERS